MMKAISILAGAAALLAVAVPSQAQDRRVAYAAGDTSFVGWMVFNGEEFELYADQNQVRRPFSRPCVSGAASRNLMRQAHDLVGRKVRITGETTAWSDDLPGQRMTYQGSNIRNECSGDFVILADSIRPAN